MGLIKWLKGEFHNSPKVPGNRYQNQHSSDKNIGLSRSESYLRALSKFNKWRQINSTTHRRQKNVVRDGNKRDLNKNSTLYEDTGSQILYEEIEFLSTESQNGNCFSPLKKESTPSTYINYKNELRNSRYVNQKEYYNDSNINKTNSNELEDEAEYAVPYNNISNELGITVFQSCMEPMNEKWNVFPEASKHTVVTDLDKSQDLTEISAEKSNITTNSNFISANDLSYMKSQFLILSLNQIYWSKNNLELTIGNSYFKHGEIDGVEISVLQMKEKNPEAFYNNYETIRKLRHPNILLLMGMLLDEFVVDALISEPVRFSLNKILTNTNKNGISVEDCLKYSLQLTDAVCYMHNRKLIHTNICSENIVACGSNKAIKLAGFELSIDVNNENIDFNSFTQADYLSYKYMPFSMNYRLKYTKHFYQAPELLANTKEFIKPTYHSDIYGICITLWEMVNCSVPYKQFTCNELIKVFSLKNAELPIYKKLRFLPFASFLYKGLEIQPENRIKDAAALKSALRNVDIHKSTACEPENVDKIRNRNINVHSKSHITWPCERTSTIKKRKQSCKALNNPYSVPFKLATQNETGRNTNSINKTQNFTPNDETTPVRRFNISIFIKSKLSPENISPIQFSPYKCDNTASACVETSKVKERIDKFESLSLSFMHDKKNGPTPKSEELHKYKLWNLDNMVSSKKCLWKFSTNNRSNEDDGMAKKCFHPISTEDYYIDDDIEDGAYFKLN